jgi:hypothetical protein
VLPFWHNCGFEILGLNVQHFSFWLGIPVTEEQQFTDKVRKQPLNIRLGESAQKEEWLTLVANGPNEIVRHQWNAADF